MQLPFSPYLSVFLRVLGVDPLHLHSHKTMHIYTQPRGGLGNQLFQYAAALYFAQKHNATVEILPIPDDRLTSAGHPRPFLLTEFSLTHPIQPNPLPSTHYLEPAALQWTFHPDLTLPDLVTLEGHFQAWQYAAAVEPQLRRELTLRRPPTGPNAEALTLIRQTDTPVSIHLRRGDYTLAIEGSAPLPLPYYRNAVQTLLREVPNPTFFVFSDDPAFAQAHLPEALGLLPASMLFLAHNNDNNSHEDLRLMSACHHHIIANSTYSWWGAWLNPRPNRIVLTPQEWMKPSIPHPDVIPSSWLRIPTI